MQSFNTQPPEGGWGDGLRSLARTYLRVSTHSRPKAAGWYLRSRLAHKPVSTHSRPKAAGGRRFNRPVCLPVSTHSRPKAAGPAIGWIPPKTAVSTHSRPKAAGQRCTHHERCRCCFNTQPPEGGWSIGSLIGATCLCFNTQPPEGSWKDAADKAQQELVSTHSRPKAAGYGRCS